MRAMSSASMPVGMQIEGAPAPTIASQTCSAEFHGIQIS